MNKITQQIEELARGMALAGDRQSAALLFCAAKTLRQNDKDIQRYRSALGAIADESGLSASFSRWHNFVDPAYVVQDEKLHSRIAQAAIEGREPGDIK